ncbi:MAG: transcriptional repressor LexA [Peptococcaceae bacterium]|jgi:repressor LexA|nr:transcriptional repressor LexA [Peptococcaceae bacterium]
MNYVGITKRQQDILEFIKKEIQTKGYPPSVREIGLAVGLSSSSTVHSHLATLELKGYLKRDKSKPRALELSLEDDSDSNMPIEQEMVQIPVVGRVTAGVPILASQNIEDYFPVPLSFIRTNHNTFILKVSGDSMIDAGILSGDYIIVEETPQAYNGQIVVALIEDSATVKTFYRENGYIRLQPENQFMEPIIVKDVKILGTVLGLFRRF